MREDVGVDVCDGSQTEDCVVFRAVGVEPGVWVGSGRLAKGIMFSRCNGVGSVLGGVRFDAVRDICANYVAVTR